MKIVFQDLLKFLQKKPSKEELSEKLFQLGHEHEICGDIFEMEITPNRGDCLSLNGLARDLKFFFGNEDNLDIYNEEISGLDIDFKNFSPNDCPRITFLEIEVTSISNKYKQYLENYFKDFDQKKNNFFTDISNYLSYEIGQPTHCYDSSKIGKKIEFNNKIIESEFKALTNKDISLKGSNCIFTSSNRIINLAGVMGGFSTACSPNTKKVLVECAYFRPESIIGKSIKYNLFTDAAHKFERGVDINKQEFALRRFIKIVEDHAKIKSLKIQCFNYCNDEKKQILEDHNRINNILGTSISRNEFCEILKNLGFKIDKKIEVPSYRHDINSNNDLSEEIARVLGYNNIKNKPLNIPNNSKFKLSKINTVRNFLSNKGFMETINFPFSALKSKDSILIDNPLDSNKNHLRLSLKENLLENLLYNERRQKESIKFFEVSDIYKRNATISRLGIIATGRVDNNLRDFSRKIDNSYLNSLLADLPVEVKFDVIPRETLDTKKSSKIFYAEIDIAEIKDTLFIEDSSIDNEKTFIDYKPISEYPCSIRDFSFSIKDLSKADEVIRYFENLEEKHLKECFLFDFYNNEKLSEVKLGFRLVFQSHSKTLSEKDIDESIKEILAPILALDNVSIPGL